MNKISILLLGCLLAGCQTFAKTEISASRSFDKTLTYPTLTNFGDQGGELIIAVYDTDVFPSRLRLPKADTLAKNNDDFVKRLELGSFVKRSGLTNSRVNPLLELGALYYFPNRFNETKNSAGKILQKVCGTVDGHAVDQAIVIDEPSGIINDKRKLVLNGAADASLIKALSGVTAKAGADYLFEFQVAQSRLRSIDPNDGRLIRQRILSGAKCKNEFLPQIKDSKTFQLTSAYYGHIKVKQAFELTAGAGVPRLNTELSLGSENERDSFLFFKAFLDPISK